MRAAGIVAAVLAFAGVARAQDVEAVVEAPATHRPLLELSGFAGIDRFGTDSGFGSKFAHEQVPGTSPLFGARLAWLFLPALPAHLQLGVEAEFALAPASTGEDAFHGRMSYFAPVFEWRGHVLLRYARPKQVEPHLLVGAGGETLTSSSPFLARQTEPVVYWGAGLSVPVSDGWRLRLDLRHGIMAARPDGLTSTVEAQIGLGTQFGAAPPLPRIAMAPPPPPRVETPPPPPDRDADGIPDSVDQCPNEPEDIDGFEDSDGCPDPDNDKDGFLDAADKCPLEAETRNGFEDDDGCPDVLPADVTSALATSLKFEPRRARVIGPAVAALKPVIAMLEAHPSIRLSIIGRPEHAKKPADADLAKRRAEAVKWYLVDQGIVEDRLITSVGAPVARRMLGFELIVATP